MNYSPVNYFTLKAFFIGIFVGAAFITGVTWSLIFGFTGLKVTGIILLAPFAFVAVVCFIWVLRKENITRQNN
ncbi:hypothetical protein [Priestia koreensis]|uniref:Uncharacterized protein n=1 Tax=Priestia koreensis TaxID=284581 RepID=A0A0M0L0B5_9BACI|nr:hypothetical protein [Priestia koreensis]KOO44322.1 hypothetical protein AMD01_13660 [Priestia koreensis]MCM3005217.1 hypothetical protein [Priestia koreensis]